LENHFDLSPQDLALLIETIGAPEVGVCLDVFNSVYHLASQAETLACLAPYARTVHVKDVDIRRQNSGFYVYGCRLGQGRMNLDHLLAALKAHDTAPALLIESWMDRLDSDSTTREEEESWLQEGIQYLRQKTIEEVHP
jgi:sugar phosphate isomerase/epimerase